MLLKCKVAPFFSVNAENDKKVNDKIMIKSSACSSRLKKNMDP